MMNFRNHSEARQCSKRLSGLLYVVAFSAVIPCEAMTIQASSIVEIPITGLKLYNKGEYPVIDKKVGFTRLILIPNGRNPGIIGYGDVVITTTQGSFSAKLPLCQDADQWQCWDNSAYWVNVPTFDGQAVEGGTNPVITGLSLTGRLQNISQKDTSINIKIVASDENNWGNSQLGFSSIGGATLPAASVCALDVNTTADLGNLTTGQAKKHILVSSNASGNGKVTFRPGEHDSNSGLIKNTGGGTLKYSVMDTSSSNLWNAADGQWQGELINDYYLQLESVPDTTYPGLYEGIMTTTLSCE
jgi:hypothetical protein